MRRVKTRVRAVALAYPTAVAISFSELPLRNIVWATQPPICQVIKRCHADDFPKISGETRTGHTGALSKFFQRPGSFRMLMHAFDRLAQTQIGESHQNSAVDQMCIHCRSDE